MLVLALIMVRLSESTISLLKEDILGVLNESKRSMFTTEIAKELRRDKEFTLQLLLEMKKLNWVEEVYGRNARGNRKRWRISKELVRIWENK